MNEEFIEVVLGLLEKAKQQDQSIKNAIEALEDEKNAIEALRIDLMTMVVGRVGKSVDSALNEQKSALETQINRVGGVVNQLNQAKRHLDWWNNFWYFGGFAVLVMCFFAFAMWFIPSIDEIATRREELSALNAEIKRNKELKQIKTANCDKRLCVKVIENKCNYGKKGDRHCVVDLK